MPAAGTTKSPQGRLLHGAGARRPSWRPSPARRSAPWLLEVPTPAQRRAMHFRGMTAGESEAQQSTVHTKMHAHLSSSLVSGGQRQHGSLAKALLSLPPLQQFRHIQTGKRSPQRPSVQVSFNFRVARTWAAAGNSAAHWAASKTRPFFATSTHSSPPPCTPSTGSLTSQALGGGAPAAVARPACWAATSGGSA